MGIGAVGVGTLLMMATLAPPTPSREAQPSPAGGTFSGLGVALTPRNFPNHKPEDVEEMFKVGREAAKYAVFIYQWSEPHLLDVAKLMLAKSKEWGYTPIVGLSPTALGGLRDKLDVPERVRKAAGNNLSFSNPAVHQPYIDTVVELAKLKPPYLCLATEINLMAFKNIQEYIYFAHVYKQLYPVIKKVSPETKVFVSFQDDFIVILDDREPGKVKEHSKLIDIFRPELDLIALTSYPSDHFPAPDQIPQDYYSRIYRHIAKSDEVMFMEIGWPGSDENSYKKQVEFIKALPKLMKDVKPKVLAWSLLHDVRTSAMGANLTTTGLITPSGQRKPAFKYFEDLNSQ